MSNYYQTYYTTGEFAKLCHTTKETLFHYDEIGILKPKIVKDNGYRYYLSQQYFEFDLIKILQEAHMSLKDIQTFMLERNIENFITMLEEKNNELEKEKRKTERIQKRIQQSISMTKYGIQTKHNDPFIQECEKEHLLTVQLPQREIKDKEMMEYISRHFEYCRQHQLTEEFPLGSIVNYSQLLEHNFNENLYYVLLNKKIKDKNYRLKPKGTYATILHEGFYDSIQDSFFKLIQFIEEEGYQIIGDAYEYEINNYFSVQSYEQYLISISIMVEHIDK